MSLQIRDEFAKNLVRQITEGYLVTGRGESKHRVRAGLARENRLAVDDLVSMEFLAEFNDEYFPQFAGLEYISAALVEVPRQSTELVLKAYGEVVAQRGPCSCDFQQVLDTVGRLMSRPIGKQQVQLGVLLSFSFNQFWHSWSGSPARENCAVSLKEDVLDFRDIDSVWKFEAQRLERMWSAVKRGPALAPEVALGGDHKESLNAFGEFPLPKRGEAMARGDEALRSERKLVVVFDICSSTTILEDLKQTDELALWRNLLVGLKERLLQLGEPLSMTIYKFIGDGWILLFPDAVSRVRLCGFLTELSKWFEGEFEEHVLGSLSRPPSPIGLMFGIDSGELIRLEMNEQAEFLGRAINVASRLQGQTKELKGGPSYNALFSRNSFRLKGQQINLEPVTVKLRNIGHGEPCSCLLFQAYENAEGGRGSGLM